jgi:hypothetical protein
VLHRRRGSRAAGNGAAARSSGGGTCATKEDAGMHRRGKGVRKDSCSCFIGQEEGRGAIAKVEIAKGGHGGRP